VGRPAGVAGETRGGSAVRGRRPSVGQRWRARQPLELPPPIAPTQLNRVGEQHLAVAAAGPSLDANLAGITVLRRVLERPSKLADAAVSAASVGAAVEVFAWSERHAGSPAARALRRPGHELQRAVGTREPTEEQLDVGRAALAEILRAEGRG